MTYRQKLSLKDLSNPNYSGGTVGPQTYAPLEAYEPLTNLMKGYGTVSEKDRKGTFSKKILKTR